MAISAASRDFVLELFGGLGPVSARAMMGGLSLYLDGQIFAILSSNDQIYLKAEGDLAAALAAEGCEKFAMKRKDGRIGTMGYWTLPNAALDDPELACDWAQRALAALR